jgi:hypothetical protein
MMVAQVVMVVVEDVDILVGYLGLIVFMDMGTEVALVMEGVVTTAMEVTLETIPLTGMIVVEIQVLALATVGATIPVEMLAAGETMLVEMVTVPVGVAVGIL